MRAREVMDQNRFAVGGAPAFSDDAAWTDLTLQEAESTIGRRILIVEGLEILRVSIASVAANAQVRVIQRLPSGDSLEIVQLPLADVDRVVGVLAEVDRVAGAAQARAEAVQAEEKAADARVVSEMSISHGEIFLLLRAAVPQDSLQTLSSRLREAPGAN